MRKRVKNKEDTHHCVIAGGDVGVGPVSIGGGWNYGGTMGCDNRWQEYGGWAPEYAGGIGGDRGIPVRLGGFHFRAQIRAAGQITRNF